ncbi:MAG: hypothetical protein ACYC9O_10085 [Candidatus Latescibacterota bacterium]
MKYTIACIAHTRDHADRIVDRLKVGEFAADQVSVIYADQDRSGEFVVEKDKQTEEGAAAGAGTGAIIGGALGWLASIGTLILPGVGPLIALGPIAGILGGAAIGAGVGGIAGSLIGMGYTEERARHFEKRIHRGDILISVQTDNQREVDDARAIFEQEGAEDITSFEHKREAERSTV